MSQREYSAGMVKLSFWFFEFRKVVTMLLAGKSMAEIKALSEAENIFSAPSGARAMQIYRTVSARAGSLYPSFYEVFDEGDIATQKLIVLVSIMNTDALFFDFMYEVIRDKLMLRDWLLPDADVRIFFKDKQVQSEKVAGWTDETIARLCRCYKTILKEAGLTEGLADERKLIRPILSGRLEDCMRGNGMESHIKALTGVR